MQKILRFIISAALMNSMLCNAQEDIDEHFPINAMKGVRLGLDFSKPVLILFYGDERLGMEATADIHVTGNFFATVEAGWLNSILTNPDYKYRLSGNYGKIGFDYNLLKPRQPFSNDILYAGVRYGYSKFNHRADRINIPDQYWNGVSGLSFPNHTMNAHWLELLLGVKAEVLKNLYVSLTFRFKFIVKEPYDKFSTPYMIPGYGYGNSNFSLGINYYVSYNINLTREN